jgi:8-oxo-dGTP diphosphatase
MNQFQKYVDYKTILSVNALIWSKGKVLLLKRAKDKKVDPGKYSGIGGKVEPGEDFYTAILREIKEETGIEKFKTIRVFSITQHPYPPTNAEWVNVYFYVEIDKARKILPNNDGEFHWINPTDVANLLMVEDLKEYIKILSSSPNSFILGFFDHDKSGKLTKKSVTVL